MLEQLNRGSMPIGSATGDRARRLECNLGYVHMLIFQGKQVIARDHDMFRGKSVLQSVDS